MAETKIKSLQEIEKLREQLLNSRKDLKARILICMTGCRALGAGDVCTEFRNQLQQLSLDKQVEVVETGCIGICALAPVMLIEPYEYLYGGVTVQDVEEIISTTIQDGKPNGKYMYAAGCEWPWEPLDVASRNLEIARTMIDRIGGY